jgi:hypothetical protein
MCHSPSIFLSLPIQTVWVSLYPVYQRDGIMKNAAHHEKHFILFEKSGVSSTIE